jgi:hypothetical protein
LKKKKKEKTKSKESTPKSQEPNEKMNFIQWTKWPPGASMDVGSS